MNARGYGFKGQGGLPAQPHGDGQFARVMVVEFRGMRSYGKGRAAYYAIRLGRVLSLKRWR